MEEIKKLKEEIKSLEEKLEKTRLAMLNIIEDLKESEERFRSIFENATVGIYRTTPDGRILMANPFLVKLLGYNSEEELKERNLNDEKEYEPEYPRKKFIEEIEKKGYFYASSRWKRRDGSTIYVREIAVAVKNGKGRTLYYDGIIEDLTELKKTEDALKESQERYEIIFRESPDGLFIFDKNGVLLDVNNTVCNMLGYMKEEIVGRRIKEFLPQKYWGLFDRRMELFRKGKFPEKSAVYEIIDKNGKSHFIEARTVPITKNGKIVAFQGIARDITERIELETFLHRLADTTPAGLLIYQDDYYVYANKAAEEITGYSRDELMNMHFWEFVHEDYREMIKERGKKRQAGKKLKPYVYELPFYTKSGDLKWAIFSTTNIIFRGRPAGLVTFMDITPQKEMEEKIKENEEKYRTLIETANDAIAIIQDDKIVYANKQAATLTGYELDEIIGSNYRKFVTEEEAKKLKMLYREALSKKIYGIRRETIINRKDGERRYVDVSLSIISFQGEKAAIVIVRDITEQKKIERQLKESEEKYRSLFHTAYDGIFLMKGYRFIDCNPMAEKLFGCSKKELIGKTPFELSPPKQPDGTPSKQKAIEKLDAALKGRPQVFEWRHRRLDGSTFDAEISLNRLRLGGEYYILAIVRDITQRKKMEQQLKESEARFRNLVENAHDAIYIITKDGFEYVNPAFERLTGYKSEEILNPSFSFWKLIHPDDAPMIMKREKAREAGEKIPPLYEFRIVRKDGKIRWVEVTTVNIGRKGEVKVMGILRDVSERKKAEEEINKLSRLHYVIGKSINESSTIRQLCRKLLKEIKKIMGIDYATIFIYDKKENLLKPIVFYGYPKDFRDRTMHGYIVDKNQPWEAVKAVIERKTRYVRNIQKYKPLAFNRELYKKYNVKEIYTVPLIMKDKLYGVLQILNKENNLLSSEDRKLLKIIAEEIAAGIAKIKAEEETKRALEEEKKFKADTAHYFFNPIAIAKGYLEIAKGDGGDVEKIEKAIKAIERIEKVVKNIVTRGEIHE